MLAAIRPACDHSPTSAAPNGLALSRCDARSGVESAMITSPRSVRPFAVSTQPELGSTIAAPRTFVPGGFPLTAHKADAAEEHELSSLVGLLTGPWVRAHDTDTAV